MWSIIYQQSEPGILRDNASDQIKIVRSRILARDIERRIQAYREKTGRRSRRSLNFVGPA